MDLKISRAIKGVGIILLYIRLLYSDHNRVEYWGLTGFFANYALLDSIIALSQIVVLLFIFLMAYEYTKEIKENKLTIQGAYKIGLKKYVELVKRCAYMFGFFLLMSYVLGLEYNATFVWGGYQIDRIIGVICNVFGIAEFFHVAWFNPTWWYFSFAIIIFSLTPIYRWIIRKIGPVIVLGGIVFFTGIWNYVFSYSRISQYLIVLALGIIYAEYEIFEGLRQHCQKFLKIAVILFLVGTCVSLFFKLYLSEEYWLDIIIMLLFVQMLVILFQRIYLLRMVFSYLGKYTLYIWLCAYFFTDIWGENFIYSFRNIWLICAVLLLGTLVLSVFLERSRKVLKTQIIVQIYQSKKGAVFFALMTTALVFVIASISSEMAYLSNDDSSIQNLLAGNVTGEPYVTHQFINIILGKCISFFYKLMPKIQWWYLYSQFIQAVGIFLIHYSIFKLCKSKQYSIAIPFTTTIVLDFVFLIYPITNVSFTIVPSILGSGIVAFLFTLDKFKEISTEIRVYLLIGLGVIVTIIHRRDTGFALLCFILLGVLYQITQEGRKYSVLALKYIGISMSFVILAISVVGLNINATEKINSLEFIEFNKARVAYMDYPHATYSEKKELFEAVGWNENTYVLAQNWCFMDEKINTENLNYITQNDTVDQSVKQNLISSFSNLVSDKRCQATLIMVAGTGVVFFIFLLIEKNKRGLLFWGVNNIGCFILILYQLISGRAIYRSVIIVLLPTFIINCLLILKQNKRKRHKLKVIQCMLVLIVMFASCIALDYTFDLSRNSYKSMMIERSERIEDYAISNPHCRYIYSPAVYNNINPWRVYYEQRPTNLIPWGGSSFYSDSFDKRLAVNDLVKLTGDVFKKEDTYLVTNENLVTAGTFINSSSVTLNLYEYLTKEFGTKGIVLKDQLDESTYVYQFLFDEDIDSYDEYISIINGAVININKNMQN